MITYPNCKINLGLHVTQRRADGYHNLETIFLPVFTFCDELEIISLSSVDDDAEPTFRGEGLVLDCAPADNIVLKAYRLLKSDFPDRVKPVSIRLRKNIPFGAGLGGGSSDAAFALKMLNEMFGLGLGEVELCGYAARLGADCAFFVVDKPAYATGIGEQLAPLPFDLLGRLESEGLELRVVMPPDSVSTREAYGNLTPRARWEAADWKEVYPTLHRVAAGADGISEELYLPDLVARPVERWKYLIYNDFERSVFPAHPAIETLKEQLYAQGARYASMTGSGAAVYGLFER